MLKMICEDWARPGMTREQCIAHLSTQHASLVKQHGGAMGIVKYIQNLRIASDDVDQYARGRGWKEAPDSSVGIWFESAESMSRAFASPEAAEASVVLEQDEKNFVDSSKISAFLSHEEVIFDFLASGARYEPNTKRVKMVCQIWKRPESAIDDFNKHWRQHGDLMQKHAKTMGFVRYAQSHTVPSAEIQGFATARKWRLPPDGLAEVWWESAESMAASFANNAGIRELLVAGEDQFIARGTAFLAREHVVFDRT